MLRTVIVAAGGLSREPVMLVPIPSSDQSADVRPAPLVDVQPPHDAGPAGGEIAAPTASGGWSGRHKLAAGLVAGSAASLALGIVFHLIRNSRASDFNGAGCTFADGNVGGPPAAGCSSRYDDIQQARNIAIGGYGGAVLLAGLGALLWFTAD
jgi:hypothetical protein